MKTKTIGISLLLLAAMILAACNPSQIDAVAKTPGLQPTTTPAIEVKPTQTLPTPEPAPTPEPLPPITLTEGQSYFGLDGKPTFLFSRNLTGKTREDFATLLEQARQGGTKLLRIHLTHGWWGDPWINKDWTVNEKWAQNWDWFFDEAASNGIYILPVFAVWADWNTGSPDYGSPNWQYNPLNKANGGPLNSPIGLFEPGSEEQKSWLKWVETLVERWQGRSNIAGWELFSEINIASAGVGYADKNGAVSASAALDFVNTAAAAVRAADPAGRPLTLSLAVSAPFTNEWEEFYENDNLDFIQIHPYIDTLDRELVSVVRQNLNKYRKPVMIGECGLWSALWSLEPEANPVIGLEHAMWAGLVSGAMNGRSLWTNDGYAIYSTNDRAAAFEYFERYAKTELPVANFSRDVDFTGFEPLSATSSKGVWGAVVGNEGSLIGWYRDVGSEPPKYPLKEVITNQSVKIYVPEGTTDWRVDFYSTEDGVSLLGSFIVTKKGKTITIPLPDFYDSIAFKAVAQ